MERIPYGSHAARGRRITEPPLSCRPDAGASSSTRTSQNTCSAPTSPGWAYRPRWSLRRCSRTPPWTTGHPAARDPRSGEAGRDGGGALEVRLPPRARVRARPAAARVRGGGDAGGAGGGAEGGRIVELAGDSRPVPPARGLSDGAVDSLGGAGDGPGDGADGGAQPDRTGSLGVPGALPEAPGNPVGSRPPIIVIPKTAVGPGNGATGEPGKPDKAAAGKGGKPADGREAGQVRGGAEARQVRAGRASPRRR